MGIGQKYTQLRILFFFYFLAVHF